MKLYTPLSLILRNQVKLMVLLILSISALFAQHSRRYSFNKNPYQSHYQRVSAGLEHVLEIKAGTLWSYGNNQYGQLGDGTNTNASAATQIGNASDWILIAAGNNHSLAIKSNGTLWAWGRNANGQLGDGTTADRYVPVQIGTNANWISITAGATHSLGIQADGTLWAWGENTFGELGIGNTTQQLVPVQIGTASNWVQVQAGYYHTLARQSNGTLWAWGLNSTGQLGDGTTNNSDVPVQITLVHNWIGIAAGEFHSLGLRNDGTLWAWGNNQDGQLGIGSTLNAVAPFQIGNSDVWTAITAGRNHSGALQVDGTLWCWGSNTSGQLGNGSTQSDSIPVQLGTRSDWVGCVLGGDFSLGYCSDGSLLTWGNNNSGQLGDGSTTQRNSPVLFPNSHLHWVTLSSGLQRTASIRSDGTFWIFGMNQYGEIGDGTLTHRYWPVRIGNSSDWSNVLIHGHHTLALKSNGTLWGWGYNSNGQLGDGTYIDRLFPIQIGNGARWRAVYSGNDFTFSIGSNGRLFSWGTNGDGQLGKGDNLLALTPIPVGNTTDWVSVSGGERHSVGLKADGTIWSTGHNAFGVLGDGSTIDKQIFTQIGTDTDWVTVSVGEAFSIAVKSNGTIWGWGRNDYGQIGDGTTTNRNIPVQIGSASNWVNVYAGFDFSMGIQADGSLWGWGNNSNGALGSGNNMSPLVPTLISSDSIHLLIDPGAIQSALVKADRQRICTSGFGGSGMLGNGIDTIIHTHACDVPLNRLFVDIETNSPVYSGDTLTFNAKEIPQGNYYWEGPNGFTSNNKSFYRTHSDPSMSGVYTVTLTYFSETSTDTQSVYVYPAIGNNIITGAQTFCMNGTTSILTGSLPSGGDGSYTYVWETSTDFHSWNSSAILSQDFPAIAIADTVWVRRIVESLSHYDTSNVLLMDVRERANTPVLSASSDTVCANSQTFLYASGNLNSATDWEWYSNSCGGTVIGTGTNLPFQTSVPVWLFARGVGNDCVGSCDSIQIIPVISTGNNTLSGDQTLCGSSATAILSGSTPTGGINGYSYKWESSRDEINWNSTEITTQDYPNHLATDTIYYRRLVQDIGGFCSHTISNTVRIEVRKLADLPIFSSAQDTICVNTQTLLSLTGDLNSAADWEWYYNFCGGQFAGTGTTLLLQSQLPATLFARGVGNGCEGPCDSFHITLSLPIGDNTIIGAQTLLASTLSAVLTGSLPTGGVVGFTFVWESSSDQIVWNSTGIYTQDYPSHLASDTVYYRRLVSDGGHCPVSMSNIERIIAVNQPESSDDLRKNNILLTVYPNPTDGFTTISLKGMNDAQISLSVYDVVGNEVILPYNEMNSQNERSWELDFRNLSKGVYLVKVTTEAGEQIVRVMVR